MERPAERQRDETARIFAAVPRRELASYPTAGVRTGGGGDRPRWISVRDASGASTLARVSPFTSRAGLRA
jgi:hypothetical protein